MPMLIISVVQVLDFTFVGSWSNAVMAVSGLNRLRDKVPLSMYPSLYCPQNRLTSQLWFQEVSKARAFPLITLATTSACHPVAPCLSSCWSLRYSQEVHGISAHYE